MAVNNVYTFSTAPLDTRMTYLTAEGDLGNNRNRPLRHHRPDRRYDKFLRATATTSLIVAAGWIRSWVGYGIDTIHGGYGARTTSMRSG